ncbi:MAG: membrane protein insertion efficiency factor YidD [Betaproteobacteria bacterium]|nr:membrane protein insertion efficiency factor YidD [Betaproteobacteria bacterium]
MRFIALKLIGAYQLFLAPFFGGGCRFSPTCSEYARRVFSEHSAPAALFFVMRRLLRCHPFCKGGEDPPPAAKQRRGGD